MIEVTTIEEVTRVIEVESPEHTEVLAETNQVQVLVSDAVSVFVPVPGPTGIGALVDVVATEDIFKYDVVVGGGKRATSNIVGMRSKIVGLAVNDIVNGFSGQVQTEGEITNLLWSWNPGDRIYLNGFGLSTIVPTVGFICRIGVAVAADSISIDIKQSILI